MVLLGAWAFPKKRKSIVILNISELVAAAVACMEGVLRCVEMFTVKPEHDITLRMPYTATAFKTEDKYGGFSPPIFNSV